VTTSLLLAATDQHVGHTSVTLGLTRALDRLGFRVGFLKPISQPSKNGIDNSYAYIKHVNQLDVPEPISLERAQTLISEEDEERLLEEVVALHQQVANDVDVVVIEGLVTTRDVKYALRLNAQLAKTLDAEVIIVSAHLDRNLKDLEEQIEITARAFGGKNTDKVLGCILNKMNTPANTLKPFLPYEKKLPPTHPITQEDICKKSDLFNEKFELLGFIPWEQKLLAPRTLDIIDCLGASIINEGELKNRRIDQVALCARTLENLSDLIRPNTLLVTPGDRHDVITAASIATLNGVPLAGLLLTSGLKPPTNIMNLCQKAFDAGLPLLSVESDSLETAYNLLSLNQEIPTDDTDRLEVMLDSVASRLNSEWLVEHCQRTREPLLSPAAFRYQLVKRAQAAQQRIVLPEGNEPRTIQAAAICQERGIAQCILLGARKEIEHIATSLGLTLPEGLDIIDPASVRKDYVDTLVSLRRHKGLQPPMAEAQLEDNVVLGTVMLASNEVDGLVSGAVHTTANTVRPALQLIKTAPNAKLVSSVFFMCLPEQVFVYGDCAINPAPDANELADIAIQSAESAAAFGIKPRVAMISYSTGESGTGEDVERVRSATSIAKKKCPELLIDGPLQYDAAAVKNVAEKKAPNSEVAGKATVYIFPDLNTGNTTYKAVQRSANVISIGPMLQGLRKPVNDLSRGALVDDIVYTIALTAIQAQQIKN